MMFELNSLLCDWTISVVAVVICTSRSLFSVEADVFNLLNQRDDLLGFHFQPQVLFLDMLVPRLSEIYR